MEDNVGTIVAKAQQRAESSDVQKLAACSQEGLQAAMVSSSGESLC